jgi:hypothetical protein
LINAGELKQAMGTASKSLLISTQMNGLDCADALMQHRKLSTINLGLLTLARNELETITAKLELDKTNAKTFDLQLKKLEEDIVIFRSNAFKHLVTCKYLIILLGGPRHPDLASIFMKLGMPVCQLFGHERVLL